MSSENHHAREAERLISADSSWTVGYETADAQHIVGHLQANTEAQLAVAFELRTANMIAAYNGDVGKRVEGKAAEEYPLHNEIVDRLGLV